MNKEQKITLAIYYSILTAAIIVWVFDVISRNKQTKVLEKTGVILDISNKVHNDQTNSTNTGQVCDS